MSILQAIIATSNLSGGVVAPTGGFLYSSTLYNWAATNATSPTYQSYQFVDGSINYLHHLTGAEYLISSGFGNSATLNINLWFFPLSNNVIILGELGQAGVPAENTGWHLSMLEIDSGGHLKGRVWSMPSGLTSTGTVTLNAWNHVYLYYDAVTRTVGMRLNNETPVTEILSVGDRHVSDTGWTYFGIGVVDSTNMGSSNRYQGYFDNLAIDSTITGSTYNTFAVASKYRAMPVMSLFADSYSGTGVAWPDSSGQNHGTTLVNAPTFHSTAPKYFTFNRSSTQYVQGPDVGSLSRWTVESWFRLSEPLSVTSFTSVITTTFQEDGGYPTGQINYTMSNYLENVDNAHLTIGFYNGTWHTTAGFIPEVGRWYHVVGAYDGNSLSQWVDGELITGINLTELTQAAGGAVRVGRRWDGSTDPQYYFPGDIAVAKIYSGAVLNSDVQAFYNATKANYPNPSSLVFNQPQGDYLMVPASSDWNLGSTYTIEFWMQANHGSNDGVHIPGGQWGLFNQGGWYYGMPDNNSILIGLTGGNLTIAQSSTADVQYAEPDIGGGVTGVFNVSSEGGWNGVGTPGSWTNLATTGGTGKGLTVSVNTGGNGYVNTITIVNPGHGYTSGDTITTVGGESTAYFIVSTVTARKWTHVAVVNYSGDQRVYYDGIEQTIVSGTHLANGWTNTTSDLYIGRLAPNYGSHFDGKLALIRISNTARYTTAFTPSTSYGSDSNTKLFLGLDNPLVDSKSHTVTNNGVTTSINIPT